MKTHLLILLLSAPLAQAQYTILRHVIGSGDAAAAGGSFTLSGTVGQPVAAPASVPAISGSLTLEGGYWTFPEVPDLVPPEMSMVLVSGLVILSWPEPEFPVLLESSADLSLWTAVSPPPVGNAWAETEADRRYYRLRPAP